MPEAVTSGWDELERKHQRQAERNTQDVSLAGSGFGHAAISSFLVFPSVLDSKSQFALTKGKSRCVNDLLEEAVPPNQ